MLIRNLSAGLCNGTRLSVMDVLDGRVLRAVVTSPAPRHGELCCCRESRWTLTRATAAHPSIGSAANFRYRLHSCCR
eukprot:1010381-Prorocentrum_minimum.AAC.1